MNNGEGDETPVQVGSESNEGLGDGPGKETRDI